MILEICDSRVILKTRVKDPDESWFIHLYFLITAETLYVKIHANIAYYIKG